MILAKQQPVPIGVFDSGFGGLHILSALRDLLPAADLVYFGDSARSPYGPRPSSEIKRFSVEIARYLVREWGIAMLVVGCNTASAAALETLKEELEIPVIGVIEAGARAARLASPTGKVGVIGTVGTIAAGAYQRLLGDLELVCQACPGVVEFVERGECDSEQLDILLERLLEPIRIEAPEALLLGCTHYPYVAKAISKAVGESVLLISGAEETAFEVRGYELANRSHGGETIFLCTGDPECFVRVGARLYGSGLKSVRVVDLAELEGE